MSQKRFVLAGAEKEVAQKCLIELVADAVYRHKKGGNCGMPAAASVLRVLQ